MPHMKLSAGSLYFQATATLTSQPQSLHAIQEATTRRSCSLKGVDKMVQLDPILSQKKLLTFHVCSGSRDSGAKAA